MRATRADVLLPDGLDKEPAGWRDEMGLSPIDALHGYLRERDAVERWANSELRKMSTHDSAGEMTAADEAILDGVWARVRSVGEQHFTPAAQARSRPFVGEPSEYDLARNRVTAVVGPKRGRVALTVEYRWPEKYGMPKDMATETYRYDFAKVDGNWRLDNRLALVPGERPIGGLF
jgi:hypothetical protein